MAPSTTVRLATCVVAATLVGAAAATLPAEARADDGSVSVPESPAAVPTVDAAAVLAGEASAAVESAVADALGGDAQAAGESTPADAESVAPPAVETAPEAAPVAASTPEPEPVAPDTTPVSDDTAGGIAPEAPPAPATSAQSSPSNVNVSVRIGSPGDNGPVTQVNIATSNASPAPSAATVTSPAATATTASASSPGSAPVSAPVSQSAAGSPASAEDDPGTWSWQWNCLSAPDLTAISPSGYEGGSLPRNWTWIWNCGGNADQYQNATATQYQPSNVNVAIRISSPGNDGPVSQANVAVAVAVGAGSAAVSAHLPQAPVIALPGPSAVSEVTTVLSDTVLPGMTALPVTVVPAEPIWLGSGMGASSIVQSIVDIVDLPRVLPPLGIGTAGVGERQGLLPGAGAVVRFGQLLPALELGIRSSGGNLSAVAAAVAAGGGSASVGTSTLRAREKPAPRWRAPRPQPIQESVPSGASIAPATGGGSSGGGIPIFLALPFLAAMLDLARRVTLDRVALPSGHRSRMPENPG